MSFHKFKQVLKIVFSKIQNYNLDVVLQITNYNSMVFFISNTFILNNVDESLIFLSDVSVLYLENVYIEQTNSLNNQFSYNYEKTGSCINSINTFQRNILNLTLLDNWSSQKAVGLILNDDDTLLNSWLTSIVNFQLNSLNIFFIYSNRSTSLIRISSIIHYCISLKIRVEVQFIFKVHWNL